jgi:predicted protein tyrosine phosphatase
MSQRIFAISLAEMERLVDKRGPSLSAWVISINCPGSKSPLPDNCGNVLVLHFDDIEGPVEGAEDKFVLFDGALAVRILCFLQQFDGAVLIIHCHAGIARSGAVAVFAHELLGTDVAQFWQDNPGISPNQHVLSVLREVSGLPAS